jgi:hypothetical protein
MRPNLYVLLGALVEMADAGLVPAHIDDLLAQIDDVTRGVAVIEWQAWRERQP